MTLRLRYMAVLSFVGALMLVALACASSSTPASTTNSTPVPTTPVASSYTISVATNDTVGNYLVDGQGNTLYWTTLDTPGMSNTKGVFAKWPAFYAPNIVLPPSQYPELGPDNQVVLPSVNASDFGTITNSEGILQTTYKGYPLYYYIGDKAPGDMLGQGLGGIWSIVDPAASGPATGVMPPSTTP